MTGKSLASPEAQGATFVELFFDLVFVFAVTQVTHYAAAHLDLVGVLRSALVFWLVWWAWTQFTWALNAADTNHHSVRLGTLISTAVAFVMAASVEQAFSDQALWFAVPYVVVRMLGLGLYDRVTCENPVQRSAVRVFWTLSLAGLVAVLIGAWVDPSIRGWFWLGAVVLDVLAAEKGGSQEGWNLHAEHFAERHGLILIIALGESLIVAGSAVATDERTESLIAVGGLAVTATCLLWWSYFGWVKDALEERLAECEEGERAPLARDAYSLLHFPIVCGIVAYAVGLEGLLHHPGEPAPVGVVIALGAGVALFVGATAAALWRATGTVLVPRALLLSATLVVLAAAGGAAPAWLLVVVCCGLVAVVGVEHASHHEPL